MSQRECLEFLARSRLARLACDRDGQPYIVPMYVAYDDGWIYGFATVGRKIDWLRHNPRVCIEVDEIVALQQWKSVVVLGRFEELRDTPELRDARGRAYDLLKQHASWWVEAYLRVAIEREPRALEPIYFRISVDEISGRRAETP